MMSKYDPWVNMLRTTVAAFAAGVGGADAVTVLPFDSALGRPDAFGRRIARNTSSLLIAESHVATVADPAGGAYAVEKLTDDLARAAWDELGRIEEAERASGIEAALADGSLRARIDETVARREERGRPPHAPAHRAHRVPEPRRDAARARARRRPPTGCAATAPASRRCATTPPPRRSSWPRWARVAAHTARATFATNLFAAGGIAVDVAGPTDGADELRRGVRRPAGRLPGRHRRDVRRVGRRRVAALRDAGARWVILAGKPERPRASTTPARWASTPSPS